MATPRTVFEQDELGNINAFQETVIRTPVPARKFTTTVPTFLSGFLPPYAPYTDAFNLLGIGNEWVAYAQLKQLPITITVKPWLSTSSTSRRIIYAPEHEGVANASPITVDGDGVAIRPALMKMEFQPDLPVFLCLANGAPYLLALHRHELRGFACPNTHTEGRVCLDPFSKWLLGEYDSRPASGPPTKRDDPWVTKIATILDLYFTSVNNTDLRPPTGHYVISVPEDATTIPPGKLTVSNLLNGKPASPLFEALAKRLSS